MTALAHQEWTLNNNSRTKVNPPYYPCHTRSTSHTVTWHSYCSSAFVMWFLLCTISLRCMIPGRWPPTRPWIEILVVIILPCPANPCLSRGQTRKRPTLLQVQPERDVFSLCIENADTLLPRYVVCPVSPPKTYMIISNAAHRTTSTQSQRILRTSDSCLWQRSTTVQYCPVPVGPDWQN